MSHEDIIKKLIAHYKLEPLRFEGGQFTQTYKSEELFKRQHLPERYSSNRAHGTAIIYLLTSDPDSFSSLHKLATDEIYHFYLGDPIQLLLLLPDGTSERVILGPNILNGQHVQYVVQKGTWQGSRLLPGGQYALLGCTMAPGFELEDFTPGQREELCNLYPQEAELVIQLTRANTK